MKPSYLFSPSVKREKHHYRVKTNNKAENGNHQIKKLPVIWQVHVYLPQVFTTLLSVPTFYLRNARLRTVRVVVLVVPTADYFDIKKFIFGNFSASLWLNAIFKCGSSNSFLLLFLKIFESGLFHRLLNKVCSCSI